MPSQSCRDVHTTAPIDEFNPGGFLGFITYIRCPEHIHASSAALASPWHIDRDEVGYRENGRYSLPLLSTVFYPHVSCAGGELLVADNPPMQEGKTGPPPRFRSVISIPPAVNRLVVFPPESFIASTNSKASAIPLPSTFGRANPSPRRIQHHWLELLYGDRPSP